MDARKRCKFAMKFAEGNRVCKGRNFMVKPNTSDMVRRLACGDYVVLVGARATGKTTTAFCAMDELREQGYYCIYVHFPALCATSLHEFWETMAWRLYHSGAPQAGVLPKPDTSGTFCEGFVRSMLMDGDGDGCEDVIIVFDDANHFSSLSIECKNSFLTNFRFLKQSSQSRLLSFMLVGTEALLKDFNIANKFRKLIGIPVPNAYSPFRSDALFFSVNFTEDEINDLLSEYSLFSGVHVHNKIAADIFKLTRGHKGLVDICCALLACDKSMVDSSHRSYSMWRRIAKSSLMQNVFSRMTYNSICYSPGDKDWILLEMLREGGTATIPLAGDRAVATAVECLVVEGFAVDSSSSDDQATLTFSSQLLQSRLLKQLCMKNELPVAVTLGPLPFDCLWVIRRTIEQLDPEVFLRPESKNADGYVSEYSLQLEYFLKIKKVLSSAYPNCLVIPEADDSANFRRRLDILIRDGDSKRGFAFELLRQGNLASMVDHYERAVWHAAVHGCQVYMLNFVLDGILLPEVESFKHEGGGRVAVYNIVFTENTALLRLVGGHATLEDTELKLQGTRAQLSLAGE